MISRNLLVPLTLLFSATSLSVCAAADQVVAFWGFAEDYDFDTNPSYQDFAADVDGTISGDANLQAYLGDPDELDDNGGGGFVTYTSPTSGIFYDTTRTLKFDDIAVSGSTYPDFEIGGNSEFTVDTGDGPETDNFGEDALLYITFDGSGFGNFRLRFDAEATPGDLPESFDVFYRVAGPSGTWLRVPSHNNIPLTFVDYTVPDPENQYADSGQVTLSLALNNSPNIELIINDFGGNHEMEVDNIEIIGQQIPEPSTASLLLISILAWGVSRASARQHRTHPI